MRMSTDGREAQVLEIVAAAPWRRSALAAVATLRLPDLWIGAGFLRAPVWDALHGHERPTPLADVDVIYHDPACLDPEA